MDKSIEILNEWLNGKTGQTLKIEKKENGDTDVVHFELEDLGERSQDNPVDDYLERALLLRGSGRILNAEDESVPLPGDTYEIVLNDLEILGQEENRITLKNDRAEYEVSLETPQA